MSWGVGLYGVCPLGDKYMGGFACWALGAVLPDAESTDTDRGDWVIDVAQSPLPYCAPPANGGGGGSVSQRGPAVE
jgi:hypothetical protein